MSTALIALAVTVYAAADLYAARLLYGHMRARAIDRHVARYTGEPFKRGPEQALRAARTWYAETDRPFFMVGAVAGAALWPLVLLGAGAARWLDTTPVRARGELEAERAQQAARIQELEAELGIDRR